MLINDLFSSLEHDLLQVLVVRQQDLHYDADIVIVEVEVWERLVAEAWDRREAEVIKIEAQVDFEIEAKVSCLIIQNPVTVAMVEIVTIVPTIVMIAMIAMIVMIVMIL